MALTRPKYSQIYDSDYKNSARVATTENVTLVGGAPTVVDDITLVLGDRVVVRAQSNTAQNGIYRVNTLGTGANGTWGRTLDADTATKLTPGTTLSIEEGTTYGGKQFRMTSAAPITLGVTAITWTDISGGGGGAVGGTNGQVQFNDLNAFSGATYLYYNGTTGQLTANGAIVSTSTTSGTMVVTGGVGISGALNVGANITVTGNVLPSANVTYNLGSPSQRWKDLFLAGNTINLNGATISAVGGAITFQNSLGGSFSVTGSAGGQSTGTFGNLVANSGVVSTSSSTGALVVTGGTGISGAVYVGGTLSVAGDTTVTGNLTVNGTTTNINTTNLVVEDKNIVLADVASPSDATADGAGITIKGTTDKTLSWVDATDAWTSSEDFNLLTGKQYEINGASVLTSTTLGSGVVNSSLTSVGTITSLVATTAVATNLSSGNIRLSGGYVTGLANIAVTGPSTLTGNVSIGASASLTRANLYVHAGNLEATTGNTLTVAEFVATVANVSYLRITKNRVAQGADWTTASTKIQQRINVTDQGYIEFNPLGMNNGIGFGSGNTEYLRLADGGNVIVTGTTTSTSTTTGALVIRGGLGVAGAINTGSIQAGAITSNNTIIASTVNAGTIGNSGATLTGTLSTAAQTNVTSLGTLTGLTVSGTTGLSVVDSSGLVSSTKIVSVTNGNRNLALIPNIGSGSYNGLSTAGDSAIVATGPSLGNAVLTLTTWASATTGIRIASASNVTTITLAGTTSSTGDIVPSANLTYNLGSTTAWWNNMYGVSVQAKYADLAEHYAPDQAYTNGTVVVFGGEQEGTVTTQDHDPRVAGVISINPAYLMNAANPGLPVALQGRVPCRVQGPVAKGDVLVTSSTPGVAQRIDNSRFLPGCVVGKALEAINTNTIETIEVVVGRF